MFYKMCETSNELSAQQIPSKIQGAIGHAYLMIGNKYSQPTSITLKSLSDTFNYWEKKIMQNKYHSK